MLTYDYTRRHNEVVRWIYLLFCNRYGLMSLCWTRFHSVQDVLSSCGNEMRVDIRA
ncbi:hypothetical protein PAPHI01_2262 [Pancytospora philotis]|nr:hypothetical protein PAPHI01_2262 [Pancytospora philotis]